MNHLTRREALIQSGKLLTAAMAFPLLAPSAVAEAATAADTVLVNGRIFTLEDNEQVSALAIAGERILAVGSDAEILRLKSGATRIIDLAGRTVIPGLNDSHMHFIRAASTYNQDLRWDGVPSVAEALRLVSQQAARTPAGQWIRVDGGWSPYQFAERRAPTVEELSAAAPDTPVYVLLFYKSAILNRAALRALGYDKTTPNQLGGNIERDADGVPTGVLTANPYPGLILSPLAHMPTLSATEQQNSARQFMRELNRFGITSVIDPGSVGVVYPQDYETVSALAREGTLTVRLAMYLLPQQSGAELKDFEEWFASVPVVRDDDWFRFQGGGEILLNEAMDWDVYSQPLVKIPGGMEAQLEPIIEQLVRHRWSFRQHATYDSTITRLLDVIEKVGRRLPLDQVRWTLDHAEFISQTNIDRVARLGGGVAVQHRFAFHGEYAVQDFGAEKIKDAPPLRQLVDAHVPLGAGTDSTRDSTYNPWVSLSWMVTGKTVGGLAIAAPRNRLDRLTALRLYTQGSAWFSGEERKKGTLKIGKLADLAVLSEDYFGVPEERIERIESVLTIVGGRIVHAAEPFPPFAPPLSPAIPPWSPAAGSMNGYYRPAATKQK